MLLKKGELAERFRCDSAPGRLPKQDQGHAKKSSAEKDERSRLGSFRQSWCASDRSAVVSGDAVAGMETAFICKEEVSVILRAIVAVEAARQESELVAVEIDEDSALIEDSSSCIAEVEQAVELRTAVCSARKGVVVDGCLGRTRLIF